MDVREYLHVLRARWKVILAITLAVTIGALGASLATTPVYESTARFFVSTTSSGSPNEIYQGNLFSQQRVESYAKLLTGTTLLQQTIDDLKLKMTPGELSANVSATAVAQTVLIDVSVRDHSATQARDIANKLGDNFVKLVQKLETPENGGQPVARTTIVQQAEVNNDPVEPKTLRNVLLGFVVGLLLGIAVGVVRHRLDNTIKDRDRVEKAVGRGLVGTIPFDKTRRDEPAIDFGTNRDAASAEAYRALRTNLQFLNVDSPPRVMVLTSSVPAEGKTTTTINLALVLAKAGHRVVLVEGDMRRPRLASSLGTISEVGLSTVLSGQASITEVVQPTKFPSVSIITAGALPPNPSELLGSDTARQVIRDLREHFDYVIIDSTPLLAVTDAVVLATEADGALMIVRYGRTKREQVARGVDALNKVNARVLGAIFTMTPGGRRDGYEGYEYIRRYGEDAPKPNSRAKRRKSGDEGEPFDPNRFTPPS